MTDCCKENTQLKESGFKHETVNHSNNSVNPSTGFHTQAIEYAWIEEKAPMQRTRGPKKLIESYLDELSWRAPKGDHKDDLLTLFLRDVRKFYGC